MRTTQQMSITLPKEMAEVVKTKVQSGEYASESEVIRDGLRALMAQEKAVEYWLQSQVASAFDALEKNPAGGLSVDELRAHLAAEKAKWK